MHEKQAQHEWLSPDSFVNTAQLDHRLDWLERSLQNWCAFHEARSQAQLASLGAMNELLRSVQADVRRRNVDTARTPQQCPSAHDPRFENKEVLGRTEWVGLPSLGTYLKARIDTGANVSSISAKEITTFERDGENWIRFKLALGEDDVAVEGARDKWIEAPVARHVRIIQASGTERRAVISLPMTLGPIEQNVEFTVNDRSHLSYPVLLGRRFMMDIAVVDIGQTYIHPRPEYPGGEPASRAGRDQADREDDDVEE